jgi:hypothetical protein
MQMVTVSRRHPCDHSQSRSRSRSAPPAGPAAGCAVPVRIMMRARAGSRGPRTASGPGWAHGRRCLAEHAARCRSCGVADGVGHQVRSVVAPSWSKPTLLAEVDLAVATDTVYCRGPFLWVRSDKPQRLGYRDLQLHLCIGPEQSITGLNPNARSESQDSEGRDSTQRLARASASQVRATQL